MTFNEAMAKLYLDTVGASLSPFGVCHHYGEYEVPCCKLVCNHTTFIMFVDNTGSIVLWEWNIGDPVMIDNEKIPGAVVEANSWHIDSWYTDDSPYNVSNWYKENGWQVH